MKPTRYFVTVLIELAASVQFCHDNLSCSSAKFIVFVDIDRNASTVISNRD